MAPLGGGRQGCKMAFVLPLAISAPASLARIRPCLSLRWRTFTFGNRDMYLSSFSLRYSAAKEKERVRLTYPFCTHFQGEGVGRFSLEASPGHTRILGSGVRTSGHSCRASGAQRHGPSLLSSETPSRVSASRFRLMLTSLKISVGDVSPGTL